MAQDTAVEQEAPDGAEKESAGGAGRLRRSRGERSSPPRIFEPWLSGVGVVLGAQFVTVSLLPSLLPRVSWVQGLATGVSFILGYALGASFQALWHYLGIPPMKGRARTIVVWTLLAIIAINLVFAIWSWVGWQNETRSQFGMESISPTVWAVLLAVAVVSAALLLVIGRSLRTLAMWVGRLLARWLPRRLAITLATATLTVLGWLLVSGLLVEGFFAGANAMFSVRDTDDKAGVEPVTSALRSGSPESPVQWEELGRQGRSFVSSAPTVEQLNDWSGGDALEPIRVYVGLKSAETLEERAELLLDELIRTGAFDRSVLVLGTTTGTGFLEPNAVDSFEFLHNGDTAIAGLQYSYLPSWISLLADQEAVRETSLVTFGVIHEYWADLPEDSRPELYLYGLSLGSYGVEAVLGGIDIINEPIDGAFLSGPPFVNPLHQDLTGDRDEGSPAWRPVVGEGQTARFTGDEPALEDLGPNWGPTRIAYLQHGSDPVVFFDPTIFIRVPEWLEGERAPDVSERMGWFPLVTGWQTLLDLPAAGSVPDGFGHMYSVRGNLYTWDAVTGDGSYTDAELDALAAHVDALHEAKEAALEAEG